MIYDYPLITNEMNIKPEPICGEYPAISDGFGKFFLKEIVMFNSKMR